MKIHILADLHLEFGDYTPAPVEADVVVMAGDIYTKAMAVPWLRRAYPEIPVIDL